MDNIKTPGTNMKKVLPIFLCTLIIVIQLKTKI